MLKKKNVVENVSLKITYRHRFIFFFQKCNNYILLLNCIKYIDIRNKYVNKLCESKCPFNSTVDGALLFFDYPVSSLNLYFVYLCN